jgi:hypothetical protein
MDPSNRTDTLSWHGDVPSTLNQEPITKSLGAAMLLTSSVLQTFKGVHDARPDFWEDSSRNDSTQVARTVIEHQQDLDARVVIEYLTVTKILLVLRGAKGEHALTYALTEKDAFDIHDRLAEAWDKVEAEGDLGLRCMSEWGSICGGVVGCFKDARLNPRIVTIKNFDRIAKAIKDGLKGEWASWDDEEFSEEVDYEAETYVSKRSDKPPHRLLSDVSPN